MILVNSPCAGGGGGGFGRSRFQLPGAGGVDGAPADGGYTGGSGEYDGIGGALPAVPERRAK
jgi:hypothetical protein